MTDPAHSLDAFAHLLAPDSEPLLRAIVAASEDKGMRVYLVGGVVRDLLLGRPNLDLDVAVEGDAVALARDIAARLGTRATAHGQFGTATVPAGQVTLDLATARTETYPHPGALPIVRPGALADDLRRRDFTINAIALSLNASNYGEIIDPLGGVADLRSGLVRIIHPQSFIDDATRMLRAARYEQRFQFHLEETTEALLRRDVSMLSTISGDRIRYEFERIFAEPSPEQALERAHSLGILQEIHPALRWDRWLTQRFLQARQDGAASPPVHASLLVLRLDKQSALGVIERLRFPGEWSRPALEARKLAQVVERLDKPDIANSVIFETLRPYGREAIRACRAASDSVLVRARLALYLGTLSGVKPLLNGHDLLAMGVPQGPGIGEVLADLLRARLDGQAATREEEATLVRSWLASRPCGASPE